MSIDLEKTKESKHELKSFRIRLWCPCGGEIVATGNGFSNMSGSTYEHNCTGCEKRIEIRAKRYPRTVHKEVSR